jgi:hypothetical protein
VPQQRGTAPLVPRPNPNDPSTIYQRLLNDAPLRAQLKESNPSLSEALESGNFCEQFFKLICFVEDLTQTHSFVSRLS